MEENNNQKQETQNATQFTPQEEKYIRDLMDELHLTRRQAEIAYESGLA